MANDTCLLAMADLVIKSNLYHIILSADYSSSPDSFKKLSAEENVLSDNLEYILIRSRRCCFFFLIFLWRSVTDKIFKSKINNLKRTQIKGKSVIKYQNSKK